VARGASRDQSLESGVYMNAVMSTETNRRRRRPWHGAVAVVAGLALSVAGLAVGTGPALATSSPRVTSSGPCNATISAGTGAVVGSYIVGVTAGTTTITFDCDASSGAAFAAEASLLAGIGSQAVMLASEADVSALGTFAPSATDTGCPAGTAGACEIATFAVPATFAASDANATCPPTTAQINAGLFGCFVAVATAAQQPLAGAEYLMTYASETTPPAAPTIAATVAAGPPGSTITISDAAANAGFWWGNALETSQAVALQTAPQAVPAACGSGAGYGNVPAAFLAVNWFAQGSSSAVAGDASGVVITNDCYDGKAVFAPTLSGTIPVPASLTLGTTYTAYLCELNVTPFPSNDANVATDCGPAPAGASWIDASFTFTPTAGTAQPALSLTSLSGTVGTALTLATTGGAGTGALSYVAVNGTASGCAASGTTLSASSAGTCIVTATKASDSTYLAVSSVPTVVAFAGVPTVSLLTSHVALKPRATSLGLKLSCANAPCSGTLNVTTTYKKAVRKGARTIHKTVKLNLGSASYSVATGSSATVSVHLSAAARAYLRANPKRPTLQGTVTVTDNLGKKHTLGRVSLLK
jgi:hypothetical protein